MLTASGFFFQRGALHVRHVLLSRPLSLSAPCDAHFAITPDDGADLGIVPRALFCGGAGSVVLRDRNGTEAAYALAAGQILPFRPVRVLATGTTATGIVGLY